MKPTAMLILMVSFFLGSIAISNRKSCSKRTFMTAMYIAVILEIVALVLVILG